jgi:hypothetical protein
MWPNHWDACWCNITFFKRGPTDPSQQCKTTSNNIQDPPPCWILTIFKLKFGGGNLFSPALTSTIEGNNYVGTLLKPLLKKVTPVVGLRMLCEWGEKDTLESGSEDANVGHGRRAAELVIETPQRTTWPVDMVTEKAKWEDVRWKAYAIRAAVTRLLIMQLTWWGVAHPRLHPVGVSLLHYVCEMKKV